MNQQISEDIDLYPILALLDTSNKINQSSADGDESCKPEHIINQIIDLIQNLFRELSEDEFDVAKIINCIEVARFIEQHLGLAESTSFIGNSNVFEGIIAQISSRIGGIDDGVDEIMKLQRDCVLLTLYFEFLVVDEHKNTNDIRGMHLKQGRATMSVQDSSEMGPGNSTGQRYEERVQEFVKKIASLFRDEGAKKLS